uniref:Uncharacterized protein n=1 Tax=Anopheles epiroticus TaxID=199890 RepID=A0A182P6Y4_9DIPT
MSDKLTGGRYNRISPSSGRGSIIAYSPLPKSEQDCLQAPGNNCLAIPLSAIQTDHSTVGHHVGPHPVNLTHANSLPVVGGIGGIPGKLPPNVAHGDGQKHVVNQQHHNNNNNNNNNNHNSNHNGNNNNIANHNSS